MKNINEIKKAILDKNQKSVALDMLVYPNGEFVIIPRGRSAEKKWIGAKVLNYKECGDFSKNSKDDVINKILKCLTVAYDYESLGIDPTDKNVEPRFSSDGAKAGFVGYFYLSILLFAATNTVKVNSLKPIDKKGSEWVGKSDTAVEIDDSNFDDIYNVLKKYINILGR